jgi:hypothetical protein
MKKILSSLTLSLLPAIAFAQSTGTINFSNIRGAINQVGELINILLPIVVALALLFFFWGLAKFILASGDEDAKDEGKRIMIWGVIALFVMASVWGLVAFVGNLVGVDQGQALRQVPGVGGLNP